MSISAPAVPNMPRTNRQAAVLAVCCAATAMASMDTAAVTVALPAIGRGLHGSMSGAQWVVVAYPLTLACLLTLSSSLADLIGRRAVFQIGLTIFAMSSLASSIAPSMGWLIASRVAQAVGGSMLTPVAMAIISAVFTDPGQRVRAIGAWSGSIVLGLAAGPLVGGFLVDAVGWPAVFWINAPIAAVALPLTRLIVPESRSKRPPALDPLDQLLVSGVLGLLVFAITEGPHRGWASPVTIGCLAGSVTCLAALLRYAPRHPHPLIDPRLFRSAPFTGAFVIAILTSAAMGGFLFLNTFYLQEIRQDSPLATGLALTPMALAMLLFGPMSRRLIARRGARRTLTAGAVLATTAAATLTATFNANPLPLTVYAIFGAGLGLLHTPLTATATAGLPPPQAAEAASLVAMSRQIGQTLGIALIGSMIAAQPDALTSSTTFHPPAHLSWLTITTLCAATLLITRISTAPKRINTVPD
ncbi:EmrB/QacA subfamily drug resistance transporter [Nocardia tenerifensis]|uniref:EmrB/QacA subfamily drug resistance transporter n=1 Tax=Nocardia tenerifensis TaxID=228006 RepID=A0A318JTQ7_9NOCA|nr:MFS transporter [Nocardia tenerifensis]PXX57404.1 EmrB/QacA subfamily drug resistance transporter [Nocardia tenerifensis]